VAKRSRVLLLENLGDRTPIILVTPVMV